MVQSNTAAATDRPASNSDAIQRTREYYFAILAGSPVYHIAHEGETVCSMTLAEKGQWIKRGSESVIPPEMRLCAHCDSTFHRGLALSKRHIRDELATLAGVERRSTGPFTKPELADLLDALRDERPVATSRAEDE